MTGKQFWIEQLNESLISACGAATCAGLTETAEKINAIWLDIPQKVCYTSKNRRETARKNEEEKKMTIYGRAITDADMHIIADYMDDALRESLHSELAPCSPEEFLTEYIKRDPDIMDILRREFDFEID